MKTKLGFIPNTFTYAVLGGCVLSIPFHALFIRAVTGWDCPWSPAFQGATVAALIFAVIYIFCDFFYTFLGKDIINNECTSKAEKVLTIAFLVGSLFFTVVRLLAFLMG